jgi:hypothetical protein
MRKQPYAYGMPKKYSKGLDPKTAKRRAAAQKMKAKLYKQNPKDPRLYKPLPGDEK